MVERRGVLKFVFGGVAGGLASRADFLRCARAAPAVAGAPPSFALGEASPFDSNVPAAFARALAKQPFKPLADDLPAPFRALNYEQYASIRLIPGAAIWNTENTGFAIEPLHRGFIFSSPIEINLVADGKALRLIYSLAPYDFGSLAVQKYPGDLGFSGFRVLAQRPSGFAELAIFQGASFFRAAAPGQTLGTMARALSIKTADPRGEELPAFRKVWIERPTLAAGALVIHAVIDSESMTGAFRFTLRPGEATIIDTECTLFARATVDNLGLATMSAVNLSSPIDERRGDDLRPAVSEVGGLAMLTGRGEWLWRPVANRETLQISTFVDENPRGFGFLQRDRDFEHYQDDDHHYETRPSLWIEPIGDWGAGGIELIEIPSDSEINHNIIAYWKPKQRLSAGSETSYAYRQFWCWSPPEQPPLAAVAQSRSGRGAAPKRRRFLVEFRGDILSLPEHAGLRPNFNILPGTLIVMRAFTSADRKSSRIWFEIDPGNEAYSEMRLVLEAAGHPVSETWLYRWTP